MVITSAGHHPTMVLFTVSFTRMVSGMLQKGVGESNTTTWLEGREENTSIVYGIGEPFLENASCWGPRERDLWKGDFIQVSGTKGAF
jgi:hypothetical protein